MKNEMFYFSGNDEERLEQLISLFESGKIKKGAFLRAIYKSQPKTKAAYKDCIVEKTTEGIFRMGIEYSNTDAFKKLDRDVQGLPFSQRRLEGYGELVQVTVDENGKPVQYKVRLYTVPNAKSESRYTIDGKETTYAELVEMGALSEKKPSDKPLIMFTVYIRNLVAISLA